MDIRDFSFMQAFRGRSLKRPVGVLLIVLGASLALWLALRAHERNDELANISKSLAAINAHKAEQIGAWFSFHEREAARLSRHPFLAEIVSTELARPGSRRDQLKSWMVDYAKQNGYVAMAMLSPKGAVITATSGYTNGTKAPFAEAFSRAVQSGKAQITDLYLDDSNGPRMAIFSPIFKVGLRGDPVCVLAGKIDPKTELYPLVKADPLLFAKAESLLVRREGDQVLFLNDLDYVPDSALKFKRPLTAENLPAAAVLKGHSGFFPGEDYRGKPVFSSVLSLPHPGWAVITKVDQEDALAGLMVREQLTLALILAAALLLYGLIYVFLLARERAAQERIDSAERALSVSEQIFSEFMEHSPVYVFFKDEKLRSLRLSRNYEKMLGRPLQELLGKSMDELFPSDLAKKMMADDKEILKRGEEVSIEEEFNGRAYITTKFPIKLEGRPTYLAGFTLDVTERKSSERINQARLHLLNFSVTHTLDELLQETLDEAEKLTGSLIAFYHFLEADQETISLQNWSTRTKAVFCKAEGKGRHYPLSKAGVWADCVKERKPVIHNDYASLKHRKGLPPGHAPVVRELAVPVFRDNKIRAILGVGNKPSDYDQADVEAVSLFANLAWDIAERKMAQEHAARMSERVLLATGAARMGVWDWNITADRLTWDERMYELYGIPKGSRPGAYEVWLRSVHPEDRARADEDSRKALSGEAPYDTGFRILLPDGESRSLRAIGKVFRDAAGKPVRMVGVNWDVTESEKLQADLKESESRFRLLFEAMEEGFATHEIICDESGKPVDYRFLDVNPAFERLTGLKRSEIIGRTVLEAMPGTEKHWIDSYGKVALEGTRLHMENFSKELGKWYEVSAFSPRRGQFAVSFFDITTRKQAEIEIKKLNRELMEKNREMENFLYITTHDLRSPLVNIQGFSQNLQRYTQEIKEALQGKEPTVAEPLREITDAKIPEALGFVIESSRKMDALISALLKVSRAGRVEPKPETLDMTELLGKVLDSMRFQTEEAGALIELGALPPCKADRNAVTQIFSNLLDNAIKYRAPERRLEVRVSGEVSGKTVVYSVSDNGPGIPEPDLGRIWNVFYRHEQSSSQPGEGIGLPMVRRIVERNGGAIKAESKEGAGTVFHIELPREESGT